MVYNEGSICQKRTLRTPGTQAVNNIAMQKRYLLAFKIHGEYFGTCQNMIIRFQDPDSSFFSPAPDKFRFHDGVGVNKNISSLPRAWNWWSCVNYGHPRFYLIKLGNLHFCFNSFLAFLSISSVKSCTLNSSL